jgi:2,4-dienoyl-CoA reductase-like NADH-dependent reductase (Old Yellow Enzyme family)
MAKLFEPLKLRDILFRNRLAMSPMCQYSATNGFATDFHLVHYGSRALGGTALIIQEATAVAPEGRITPGDLGLYKDEHIGKLREITSFIRQYGAIAGVQLAHAGRKAGCAKPWDGGKQLPLADGGWRTVAPSAIAFQDGEADPLTLDEEGIRHVISDFRTAAQRAIQAGFQLIEIHAAHGYLIHQSLSPISNLRNDNYGGSFENRTRLLREIIAAVREVWAEGLPLFVRISATDYVEGGWNVDEAVQLCSILKQMGVDLIDCSSGGLVPYAKIPFSPGYQVAFSDRIKKETGIMTGAVGLITSALQAEEILAKGSADMIIIGRELLRDPHFTLHAAFELGQDIEWPRQYGRAKR